MQSTQHPPVSVCTGVFGSAQLPDHQPSLKKRWRIWAELLFSCHSYRYPGFHLPKSQPTVVFGAWQTLEAKRKHPVTNFWGRVGGYRIMGCVEYVPFKCEFVTPSGSEGDHICR